MEKYLKKIAKDTGWVLALNSVNYASSFVIGVLVSRFLNVEQLGNYTFIAAAAAVIYLISDFGLTTLIVRKIGEDKANTLRLINNAGAVKLALGAVCAAGFFIIYLTFDIGISAAAMWLGIAAVFPRLLQANYESAIRVFGIQKYPAIIRSANSLLQIVFSLFFLMGGYGLPAIFAVILVLEFLTAIVFVMGNRSVMKKNKISKPETNELSFRESKILAAEGSVFFLYNFLRFSMPTVNIFLLEFLRSAESVGIYSGGARFVSGIGLLTGAVFNSYYPLISGQVREERLKITLTKKLLNYAIGIGIPVVFITFLLSNILIDLTFRIEDSKDVLRILSFTLIPSIILPVLQSYFFSSHYEKFILNVFTTAWILNLLLTIVMINFYNYIGAAVSVLIIEYILLLIHIFKFSQTRILEP